MECKLCGSSEKICDSHIIPKAFFKTINDEKKRSLPFSTNFCDLNFVQNGIKEKLLCSNCELKFSRWESTFSKDLIALGTRKSNYLKITSPMENLLKVENLRYKTFKLAAISILWRMAISKHKLFGSYSLGPYEEKIRVILKNGQCPPENRYSLMVTQYQISGKFHSDMILGFPLTRFQSKFIIQKFIIWGHMFIFMVNDRLSPDVPMDCFLRENGSAFLCVCDASELVSDGEMMSRMVDDDVTTMMKKLEFSAIE